MGFKVQGDDVSANNGKDCFDGTPSSIKNGQLKREKTAYEKA